MTSFAADGVVLPAARTRITAAATAPDLSRWRRTLTWALGLIWLLDAGLQYQPYMFTTDFPNSVIKPVGAGSPFWVSSPTHWAGSFMAQHINPWNGLFATIQLVIAAGFFFRRTTKLALASSIMWAIAVWWLGEGLGGVLAGPVSPLMGLPGAVIIYALIAILVWPRDTGSRIDGSVAEASPLGRLWPRLLWLVLWAAFAFEALRPANRAPSALHDLVMNGETGEPSWVKAIDRSGASVLAHHGTEASFVLAALCALIAVSIFVPIATRSGIAIAVVISLLIWTFGENFGALATGKATDPNSGLPLALFALCYWPLYDKRRQTPRATP